ncbi:CbrC family protein [Streptomyces sp. NBC_01537]|uniref:CbrC family protein n=1 Tax=Streptomyces sp. NBC_01537 TaxID=2903896 RepID=UPI0038709AD6
MARTRGCIADGSAAERYEAQFTEVDSGVAPGVARAVETRTPGFSGWQQERRLVHCGDGAAFLGRVGAAGPAAHPDADGQPTGNLFKCRTCGEFLAYADCT